MKNTHGGLLLLVRLQAEVSNFTKRNTPPWVFFTFFKLHKWYQKAFKKLTIFFVSNPVSFNGKSYQKRNGLGISD